MKALIFIAILFLTLTLHAQRNSRLDSVFKVKKVNVSVGFADYLHVNFPSHNFGFEVFPVDKLSAGYEHGFIFEPEGFDGSLKKGRKSNFELRFYPNGDNLLFFGLRFHHRKTTVNSRYTLGYECSETNFRNCVYYTDFSGDIKADFYATQLTIGSQFYIYDRIYFEYSGAFGRLNHVLDRASVNGGNLVESNRLYNENRFERNYLLSFRCNIKFYFLE